MKCECIGGEAAAAASPSLLESSRTQLSSSTAKKNNQKNVISTQLIGTLKGSECPFGLLQFREKLFHTLANARFTRRQPQAGGRFIFHCRSLLLGRLHQERSREPSDLSIAELRGKKNVAAEKSSTQNVGDYIREDVRIAED